MQTLVEKHKLSRTLAGGAGQFDNDDQFIALVADASKAIDKLNINAKLAIQTAYIFSRKVPTNERQDLFQELLAAVLASGTEKLAFAYAIVRRDWQNWYKTYKLHSQYYSGYLSETITNSDGEETELAELLVGEVEFERKQIDKLDAQSLWHQIPTDIQSLVIKRLQGKPLGTSRSRKGGRPKQSQTLDNTERSRLNRWIQREGYKLLIN